MISYQVSKHILGFLCAHENEHFDHLFPHAVDSHVCYFLVAVGDLSSNLIVWQFLALAWEICFLSPFLCDSAPDQPPTLLVFAVEALLWLVKRGIQKLASLTESLIKVSCSSALRKYWATMSNVPHQKCGKVAFLGRESYWIPSKRLEKNLPHVMPPDPCLDDCPTWSHTGCRLAHILILSRMPVFLYER